MATSEAALNINKQDEIVSDKILGAAAMIGAPMLMVEAVIRVCAPEADEALTRLMAFLELTYVLGWICGAVGARRLLSTGAGKGAKVLFRVQITSLILAALFNAQDLLQISERTGVLYSITDAAYPSSHLLMIVVGVFTVRAKVWRGTSAIAPFLVGLALPAFFAASAVAGSEKAFFVFPVLTAIGLLITARLVYCQKKS